MDTEEVIVEPPYSPSAVLNLFNNAISVRQTQKLIRLKGIFLPGKGQNYSGYYYDSLRDESSDAQLTIIIPALIRNQLTPNKTVTVYGYITKRVAHTGSRIDIQLTITELVAQTQNRYTEAELQSIEILQDKASRGYKDVHSWIKEQIIREAPFKIAILIGRTAIIDNDIKHQLRESIGFYDISFQRVSLHSEAEILSALNNLDEQRFDIIAVSRGGGENLDIFNKPALASRCISLNALFMTAIGHKDDVTLLQKIADRAFITPSELGQFLNDTYNQTREEVQHSKAKLVESVTAQLKANYQKQVDNLADQLKTAEKLKAAGINDLQKVYEEKVDALKKQMEGAEKNYREQLSGTEQLQHQQLQVLQQQVAALSRDAVSKDDLLASYKDQVTTLSSKSSVNWGAVIIAIIVGIIIGVILRGR